MQGEPQARKLAARDHSLDARGVSFVHCPDCQRAYNLVGSPACPHCGVRAGAPADPTEDILVAAEQLARAVARATPAQLAEAETLWRARSPQRALPVDGVPIALLPAPEPARRRLRDRLTEVAATLIERLPGRWPARARALLPTS